jgi:hypothetical protein
MRRLPDLALLVMLIAPAARADIVMTSNTTYFGHVLSRGASVTLAEGCDLSRKRTFPAKDVRAIVIDPAHCLPYQTQLPSAGLGGTCDRRFDVLEVTFTDSPAHLFADDVLIDGEAVHLDLGTRGMLHGPTRKIRWILSRQVCPATIEQQAIPALPDFCHEPFQVAVNFSAAPVLTNRIFTKGVSIIVQFDGQLSDSEKTAVREQIRSAIQTAITHWTSVLQQHRADLTPELAQYVESIIARSSKYMLLTAPQVIAVECPADAMLQVRWLSNDDVIFPTCDDYLAKAQIEGRTIAVNARDFAFQFDLRGRTVMPAGVYDLTTVMLHELGHAFGLRHAPPNTLSVMAEVDPYDEPTDYDAASFVAVLAAQIKGSRTGELNPESCGGLRAH